MENSYYLKCKKCGHDNLIDDKYKVFCSSCKEKLHNNFQDWVLNNPGKTFEDYQRKVCKSAGSASKKDEDESVGKVLLKYVAVPVILMLIGFGVKFLTENTFNFTQEDKLKRDLQFIVQAFNQKCPMEIEEGVRMDNCEILEGNILQYNITFVQAYIEAINIDELKEAVENEILQNVKSNPDVEQFKYNNVTLNYSYHDHFGEYLFTVSVPPDKM